MTLLKYDEFCLEDYCNEDVEMIDDTIASISLL